MDIFDLMKKASPKRKVALSTSKIQIQVGVGKGLPSSETAENSEAVSSTNSEEMEVVKDELEEDGNKPEVSAKPDEGGKEEEFKKEPPEERKRKRSADSNTDNAPETGNPESATATPDDSTDSTPQKLQKTEWAQITKNSYLRISFEKNQKFSCRQKSKKASRQDQSGFSQLFSIFILVSGYSQ